ncbi:L,D-transpeptidase family protein [Microbulbifer guangxiensis]|uniref:L,D-transpeptidase family protein n=1 Tax=Microbulbifer guangxiensis TaxID=2904249 RepID=UPI001F02BEA7|nr:L,D-transpeptidase family protein [Microbulbifer guangxiensis]
MVAKRRRWQRLAAGIALSIGSLTGSWAASPEAGKEALDPAAIATAMGAAAERYRGLADRWQPPDQGQPLLQGQRHRRVAQLREILRLYGDYRGTPAPLPPDSQPDAQRYDSALARAVERYQRRHGLEVTGNADTTTLLQLSTPPTERARQLEVNAARWKKLASQTGERYLLVNVPAFELQLVEKGRITLQMKTVVGKTSTRTPSLRSRITNVVFNPTWTVPRSILLTDLLPKARNNPEAMHRRGYRVVNYGSRDTRPISPETLSRAAEGQATLRQISGPGNTLGHVKFILPNKQAIFLHDTQAQSLFEHNERAFSHGCIRLKEPEELAYALLRPQGWDRTRVAEAATGNETLNIRVDDPPRLVITYLTAWVDGKGRAHFRRDIYQQDQPEEASPDQEPAAE